MVTTLQNVSSYYTNGYKSPILNIYSTVTGLQITITRQIIVSYVRHYKHIAALYIHFTICFIFHDTESRKSCTVLYVTPITSVMMVL